MYIIVCCNIFILEVGNESHNIGLTYLNEIYFIRILGMHNEFVGTRAPRAAAFVCFKAAEEGGEFIIADGRKMFRDLSPKLVEELYTRGIRYSVMELPFFGFIDNLPDFVQEPVMGAIKGLATAAINSKVDFDVDLRWGEGGYDSIKMLQARAPAQKPIVVQLQHSHYHLNQNTINGI